MLAIQTLYPKLTQEFFPEKIGLLHEKKDRLPLAVKFQGLSFREDMSNKPLTSWNPSVNDSKYWSLKPSWKAKCRFFYAEPRKPLFRTCFFLIDEIGGLGPGGLDLSIIPLWKGLLLRGSPRIPNHQFRLCWIKDTPGVPARPWCDRIWLRFVWLDWQRSLFFGRKQGDSEGRQRNSSWKIRIMTSLNLFVGESC